MCIWCFWFSNSSVIKSRSSGLNSWDILCKVLVYNLLTRKPIGKPLAYWMRLERTGWNYATDPTEFGIECVNRLKIGNTVYIGPCKNKSVLTRGFKETKQKNSFTQKRIHYELNQVGPTYNWSFCTRRYIKKSCSKSCHRSSLSIYLLRGAESFLRI